MRGGVEECRDAVVCLLRHDHRRRQQCSALKKEVEGKCCYKIYMFIGEYIHSVDDKKRLSVPSKFRRELGKKAIITLGLNKCLSIYPPKEWKAFAEKLSKLSMGKAEDRGFSRAMLAGAFEVEIDAIGRIVIPETLKGYASLKEKVVLTGAYDRVEVWDEEAWKLYKAQMVSDADRMAEELGARGVF